MSTVQVIPLPTVDEDDAALGALRFLSDGNRLRVLRILSRRESCVCELIEQIGLTQPLISYHLRRLREAGLVRTRRKAQWVYYSIEPEAWDRLTRPIRDLCAFGNFPPEAAYGASDRCSVSAARPGSGAGDAGVWPEE